MAALTWRQHANGTQIALRFAFEKGLLTTDAFLKVFPHPTHSPCSRPGYLQASLIVQPPAPAGVAFLLSRPGIRGVRVKIALSRAAEDWAALRRRCESCRASSS